MHSVNKLTFVFTETFSVVMTLGNDKGLTHVNKAILTGK